MAKISDEEKFDRDIKAAGVKRRLVVTKLRELQNKKTQWTPEEMQRAVSALIVFCLGIE